MSGLIDMWTEKLAKLREKGGHESVVSNDPTATKPNGNVAATASQMVISSFGLDSSRIGKFKMPTATSFNGYYSEASISMLVDCFSA